MTAPSVSYSSSSSVTRCHNTGPFPANSQQQTTDNRPDALRPCPACRLISLSHTKKVHCSPSDRCSVSLSSHTVSNDWCTHHPKKELDHLPNQTSTTRILYTAVSLTLLKIRKHLPSSSQPCAVALALLCLSFSLRLLTLSSSPTFLGPRFPGPARKSPERPNICHRGIPRLSLLCNSAAFGSPLDPSCPSRGTSHQATEDKHPII